MQRTVKELPWAVDREQALAEGAPEVSRRGNRRERDETGDLERVEDFFTRKSRISYTNQ